MLSYLFIILYGVYAYFIYKKVNSLFKKYSFLEKPDARVSKQYSAFTRNDYSKWNKTTFVLCGIFLLPFRVMLAFFSLVSATMILKLLVLIFGIKDFFMPQPPLFIFLCKITLRIYGRLILFSWGYYSISYKTKKLNPTLVPYFNIIYDVNYATIVCNHTAFVDIFFFLSQSRPVSFISNQAVQNYPFVGIIAKIIQCVFVNRTSKESRGKCLQDLKERVASVQKNPKSKIELAIII